MKRVWFIAIPIVFALTACSSGNNINAESTVTNTETAVSASAPSQPSKHDEAWSYYNDMKDAIDELSNVRKNYGDFITAFSQGKYGAAQTVNQISTFSSQIDDAKIKAGDVEPPPDLQDIHKQFVQSATDLLNSMQSIQDGAVHAISGSPQKDLDNASYFLTKFDNEWLNYLTTVNNMAKGQ